jgi:hypothetical protein
MAKKTIEDYDKEITKIQAQRDAIIQRQKKAEREQVTRQKIILGGWLVANDSERVESIKATLTRDQDRSAFGLQPLDDKKTLTNAEAGVLATVFVPH